MPRQQINITTRLIDCPAIVPDTLRAGPEASAQALPGPTAGGWVNFGQLTEAARLGENRDKRTLDQLYRNCAAENARINAPEPRRRFLGIF